MNFLLHIIGMAKRAEPIIRPTPRQLLLQMAANAVADGEFSKALRAFEELAENGNGYRSAVEFLIRGHLHLATHDYPNAGHFFSSGIARLNGECEASAFVSEFREMVCGDAAGRHARQNAGNRLERLIDIADGHLREGRYVRALEMFQRARTMIDTLLAAHAGMIVADARVSREMDPKPAMASVLALSKLGDLLLRMLARTHLASNVAVGLRQRSLREDLAPWATTSEDVDELLRSEFTSLREGTRQNPDHAEMHYRLGLVSRAVGELQVAEWAFSRVVQLHPHHVLSATRLAATLLQNKKEEAVMPLLAVAFAIPAEALKQYASLAETSTDRPTFELAVVRLCLDLGGKPDATTVRANLAFALAELGLLDEERATWREAAAVS